MTPEQLNDLANGCADKKTMREAAADLVCVEPVRKQIVGILAENTALREAIAKIEATAQSVKWGENLSAVWVERQCAEALRPTPKVLPEPHGHWTSGEPK